MKNLAKSLILILGLGFISFQSNATENKSSVKQNPSVSENPWVVFKEVIANYKTSNVKFYYTSKEEQDAFITATEEMKQRISENSDFHSEEKLKRIDQTVTVFKFLWEMKEELGADYSEIELIDIPEVS